jgi:hypothetical protein
MAHITTATGRPKFRGRANRLVRLATTGRRLAALSSVDAQDQGASLLRRAMHPPGPPLADRTRLCARPLIALDHTIFASTFSGTLEGHQTTTYKMAASADGTLHSGFRRMFDGRLRNTAERVNQLGEE